MLIFSIKFYSGIMNLLNIVTKLCTTFILYSQVVATIQTIVAEDGDSGINRGAIINNIINNDAISDVLSKYGFDSHQFIDKDLDYRVDEVSKRIKLESAADFLERFGYEEGDRRGLKDKRLEMFLAPALKLFQRRMEIPETGELDERTKHEMAVPRCAFPDYQSRKSDRSKRYILGNSHWTKADFPLKVFFTSHSRLMGRDAQERAFMEAANSWARVSGLKFVKGTSGNANIRIGFTHHDGPWGVLGKAWFPRVGRIEFENGENWVDKISVRGSNSGSLSFYSVAMHELGHALGISHSNVRNAIMHGQYQRDVLQLTGDDVKAITRLYGRAAPPTAPPKPPTTKKTISKAKKQRQKRKERRNNRNGKTRSNNNSRKNNKGSTKKTTRNSNNKKDVKGNTNTKKDIKGNNNKKKDIKGNNNKKKAVASSGSSKKDEKGNNNNNKKNVNNNNNKSKTSSKKSKDNGKSTRRLSQATASKKRNKRSFRGKSGFGKSRNSKPNHSGHSG